MSKALERLFFVGRPLGPLYSLVMKLREKLYHRSFFRSYSLPVPVISVGNLMLGGTGKTPTVQHIARLLLQHGYRPAVISRGYGGTASAPVNVVSDGDKLLLSPEMAGDEPYLLATSLPSVPVLTGKKRILPCRHAIDALDADVLILDDGFQHLSVKRDIDLVLFDSTEQAGNSRVFPGGPLREPVAAMDRCHAFLLTGKNETNAERAELFAFLLKKRFPTKLSFFSTLQQWQLVQSGHLATNNALPETVFGFCGIANPERFEKTLCSLGLNVCGMEQFRDHSPYSQDQINKLCEKALELKAKALITTQKDMVKLSHLNCTLPLFSLQIENSPEQGFDNFLLHRLKSHIQY